MHIPAWRRLVMRLEVDVRPGERRSALLLFLGFFLVVTFQYATKSVRQSAFIDNLGAQNLPWVYLAVALCSYPVLHLYGRVADRLPRRQLIPATSYAVALGTVAFWWLLRYDWQWLPFVFYVWIGIAYALNYSQFWTYSSHVFNPRQARRLFGFIGAGGLLGGIVGGQVAGAVSRLADTRTTLLVAAVLIVAVSVVVSAVRRRDGDSEETHDSPASGKEEAAASGFEIIRRSKQLRLLAALMVLTILVAQIVDLQFNWAVEQITVDLDQRTRFFGNFYSLMNLAALVFQVMFTARIHRRLGVAAAMRILPATMGAGTVALFVAATISPVAVVTAAVALKAGEMGLRYSLDQSTRELLYLPIASRLRAKAKAVIDVFFHRGAKGLAALVLLPVTFGWMTAVGAGWLSLVFVAAWLVVAGAAYRSYVAAFRRGLEERTVDHRSPIDIADPTTLEILMQSLGSLDRRQVLHALDILDAHGRADLAPPLLLNHEDAEVRRRTLQVLAAAGRREARPLIETLLADENAEVRAAAVRALAALEGEDVCQLMLPRLRETEAGVRAAAVACLATYGDEALIARAGAVLDDLLSDEDPAVRADAAKTLGVIPEPRFSDRLVRLVYDPEPAVAREAIAAVRRRMERAAGEPAEGDAAVDGNGGDARGVGDTGNHRRRWPIYLPTLVAQLRKRRVKHEARAAVVALGEPVIPALAHFLRDEGEDLWVRRALPKTIARIGGETAADTLLGALDRVRDAFLRRKLIEALGGMPAASMPAADEPRLEKAVETEARRHSRRLRDLCAAGPEHRVALEGTCVRWNGEGTEPGLFERLLAERMDDHLRNLFGLLALVYPAASIQAARRSLESGRPALRANALEYLDNTLAANLRALILPAIDDKPLAEKLAAAARRFGLPRRSKVDVLRDALDCRRPEDENAVGLTLGALYKIHTDRVEELYVEVERLARESEKECPLIAETAHWIRERIRERQGR